MLLENVLTLKEELQKKKDKKRKIFHALAYSLRGHTFGESFVSSKKLETPPQSPTWAKGDNTFGSFLVVFLGIFSGNWLINEAAGTQPSANMECCHCSWGFNLRLYNSR